MDPLDPEVAAYRFTRKSIRIQPNLLVVWLNQLLFNNKKCIVRNFNRLLPLVLVMILILG
jgi:hypothetical protein